MSELRDRLEREILPLVSRPSRYIGEERNVPGKDPGDVRLRFLLAFPDVYELGMSHLGLQVLYDIINRRSDTAAERCYAPWTDMEALMREKDVPLFSLESHSPARDFDVLGFTLQYELHYTNVLNMLDLAGIPLRATDRDSGDPFVIAGGPCAFNPEPVAEFFDAIVLGDGETAVLEFADLVLDARADGADRGELLRRAAGVTGVYVPSLYEERRDGGVYVGTRPIDDAAPDLVERRVERALTLDGHPASPLVPISEATHDRLSVEISRGCTRGCRFCQVGMTTRPVRMRPVDDVVRIIEDGLDRTGYDEVSLVSLTASDYDGLPELVSRLNEKLFDRRVGISLPSLRVDSFSLDIAKGVGRVRKSGLTFAPEAGTQRLRDVINKNETEEHIYGTIDAAFAAGWNRVKLYFMIGLPTETDEDIEGIARMVARVRGISKQRKKSAKINVSISPFVPKPHTPFQWEPQDAPEETKRKERMLADLVKVRGAKLSLRDPEISYLEGVMARGDRALARVVEAAWRAGARMDGWTETFDFGRWKTAFESAGVSPDHYLREIDEDEPLYWDHLAGGPAKRFLAAEREKAHRGETTEDCREVGCIDCAGCQRGGDPSGGWSVMATELPPPVAATQLASASGVYGRRARVKRAENGDAAERWRVTYAKLGGVRFISHLDVTRAIARALSMSGLPLAYSQGYNPHPKLSFGPPLPVGSTGECELFDVEFARPVRGEDVLARLRETLPGGLDVTEVRPLRTKSSIMSEVAAAEYEVENLVSLQGLTPEEITRRASELRETERAFVERGGKTKELRPSEGILDLAVIGEDTVSMKMVLAVGVQGALRPQDVVRLMADEGAAPAELAYARRTGLFRRPAPLSDKLERA